MERAFLPMDAPPIKHDEQSCLLVSYMPLANFNRSVYAVLRDATAFISELLSNASPYTERQNLRAEIGHRGVVHDVCYCSPARPATKQRRVAATFGAEPQYIAYTTQKKKIRQWHVIWKPHGRGRLRGRLATSEGVSKWYCERRMCAALSAMGLGWICLSRVRARSRIYAGAQLAHKRRSA